MRPRINLSFFHRDQVLSGTAKPADRATAVFEFIEQPNQFLLLFISPEPGIIGIEVLIYL